MAIAGSALSLPELVDVVVVGAGPSGAVAAARFAAAGLSVVCLEQGGWIDRGDYPGNRPEWELESRSRWSANPNVRRLTWDYPIDVSGSDVPVMNFNGVGGASILYAAQWPRLLPVDLRSRTTGGYGEDWPVSYQELQPWYEEVDRQVGVSGMGGNPAYPPGEDPPLPALPIGEGGLRVARAHARLGWHWWPGSNAILSAPYRGRHPCVQRGTCMQGCNEGAKSSADLTHWSSFAAGGGHLVTGARVTRISLDPSGLAEGVDWVDASGEERHTSADLVVCAANGVGTARLLLASADDRRFPDGLANRSGLVGRRLMMHAYALVSGFFDEDLGSTQGQFGCSIESLQFYRSDEERGFVGSAKWGLVPTGGPLRTLFGTSGEGVWGDPHHDHVRARLGRGATWGVLGEDLADEENRVELSSSSVDAAGVPIPRVTYRFSDNTRALMSWHVERATESLGEAGARDVSVEGFRPTGHLLGTARMGADRNRSVVDHLGLCHDIGNLLVVDGSTFVTSGGVNPTSTICALALRAADAIATGAAALPRPSRPRTFAPSLAVPASGPPKAEVDPVVLVPRSSRRRFSALADVLIPGTGSMPAPSALDVSGRLLDRVLAACPNIGPALQRSLEGSAAPDETLRSLLATDPEALAALRQAVAGAYYLDDSVRDLIGYAGQAAQPVNALEFPRFLEEDLLDRVLQGWCDQ